MYDLFFYLQTKNRKELVGFLTNDFLLLAQPGRPLGQPFSFDRHSHVKFKIYKQVKPPFNSNV